jgi:hypothetical protein
MQIGVEYWAWLGTIYLGILTWKDFKNNMLVDDRHNYFMMGVSISLISHVDRPLWMIFGTLLIIAAMYWALRKTKGLGEADIKSLGWIFFGYAIINVFYLLWFFLAFFILTAIYMSIKLGLKIKQPTPFYIVILLAYIFLNSLWGLY